MKAGSGPEKMHFKGAVALGYGGGRDDVPFVALQGDLLTSDEIVKIAERFGIPVVEKPELVRALMSLEEGTQIPEDLYEAVAIILDGIDAAKRDAKRSICQPAVESKM